MTQPIGGARGVGPDPVATMAGAQQAQPLPPRVASQEGATSPANMRKRPVLPAQPHNVWALVRPVGFLLLGAIVAASLLAGGHAVPSATPLLDAPALTLADDFAAGSVLGLRREADGTLVLDDQPIAAELRPRAYAEYTAFGFYLSPPLALTRPTTHVEATLAADLPSSAAAVLEVRGRTPDGLWTPWAEVEPGGPPAPLGTAAEALSYRITLLGAATGDAGPRVRSAELALHVDRWRLASAAAAPQAVPPTMRVWATREGLVGARTANGHVIEPNDRFVALPSRRVLNSLGGSDYTVTMQYRGRSATVPVWDIGPWNIRDNYWDASRELFADLTRWMPQAQAAFFANHNQGRDQFGRFITLPTALDIADGTFWEDLGMTANDWVEITFNWVDAPSPPWVPPVTVVPKPTPTPVPKPKAASYNAPPAPAPRIFAPVVFRAFEGWSSTFVVKNPNPGPATGTIDLYNPDGSPQAALSFTLPANGTGTYPVRSFEGLPGRFSGAAIISASVPVAAIVHEDRDEMDRMAYPAQTGAAATLHAPLIIKELNNWDTIIHVQNVDAMPADVQITYFATGSSTRTWTDTATIPPLGKRTFSQFHHPQLPAGFVGSAVIRAVNGAQIVAIVNEVKTEGAAVSYPAAPGGAPTSVAPFVLRNYQGWSTGIQVQNVGSAPTTAVVTYTRSNGPGTWTDSAPIPPGGAAVFYQPAHAQLPDDFLGTAFVASSDGAPLAVLVNVMNPQSTAAMNYLASATSGPLLALPYVARRAEGWNTGILVHNPTSLPSVVRVTYYDTGGTQIGRDEDTVPAGGTQSYFQQRHGSLPDGFVGSAVVQSANNTPLVAVASEVYSP